jgi:O-antigen/teichoic acid export membrane protein
VGAVSLITFPAFFGAASVSSTVIEALYGHRWMNATPLFLPLALAMPIHALMVGSVILWAKGLVGRELRVQLWVAAVFIIMLLITSRISLIALAWGVFIVYFIRSAWLTKTILHSIQVPWQRFGLAIRGGLLLGLVTSLVLASLDHFLIDAGSAPITRLVMAMAMGVVLVAVMPVLMKKLILTDDLRWLFANVVQKLPARFHPLAKYLLI